MYKICWRVCYWQLFKADLIFVIKSMTTTLAYSASASEMEKKVLEHFLRMPMFLNFFISCKGV